jgi:adenine deaminase
LRVYLTQIFDAPPVLPADGDVLGKRLFTKRRELVRALHDAGVPLLAGTDAPMRNVPPGFGLHEELAEFVRSGLSPAAALRAATYEPARYFDALDSLGTVAPGKLADLVLLDRDPLRDIANAHRIRAVMTRGRIFARADLDAMLQNVEEASRPRHATSSRAQSMSTHGQSMSSRAQSTMPTSQSIARSPRSTPPLLREADSFAQSTAPRARAIFVFPKTIAPF